MNTSVEKNFSAGLFCLWGQQIKKPVAWDNFLAPHSPICWTICKCLAGRQAQIAVATATERQLQQKDNL